VAGRVAPDNGGHEGHHVSASKPFMKRCPACPDGTLVERPNRVNGSRFLGCTNWPVREDPVTGLTVGCDHTEPIPAYVQLIRSGAAQLPGMEDL
jgi:hypothetical protein